jgi:hypothetical protein
LSKRLLRLPIKACSSETVLPRVQSRPFAVNRDREPWRQHRRIARASASHCSPDMASLALPIGRLAVTFRSPRAHHCTPRRPRTCRHSARTSLPSGRTAKKSWLGAAPKALVRCRLVLKL